MGGKRLDLDAVHFGELVGILNEADDLGVLLRGHLWLEALLEYAARGKLKNPDAIEWAGARFEHKIALAEAVGAVQTDLAIALRGFNRLRNRLAHELDFSIHETEIGTLIGRLDEDGKRHVQRLVDKQLQIYWEVERAKAEGAEIEWDPELAWYPRVMTPARARLFGFVVHAARSLALEGAFGAWDRKGTGEPGQFLDFLDSDVERLTGGMFRFKPSDSAAADEDTSSE